jgi:hypothetical protein
MNTLRHDLVEDLCGVRRPSAPGILGVLVLLAGFCGFSLPGASRAESAQIPLTIRDHRFYPAELEVTSGEKHLLVIENADATAEEFESHALHREKIIPAKSTANVYIGPLKPGRYEFIGEFNADTAKGVVIAK